MADIRDMSCDVRDAKCDAKEADEDASKLERRAERLLQEPANDALDAAVAACEASCVSERSSILPLAFRALAAALPCLVHESLKYLHRWVPVLK